MYKTKLKNHPEAMAKETDLQAELGKASAALVEQGRENLLLQKEVMDLHRKVEVLEKAQDQSDRVEKVGGTVYLMHKSAGPRQGPYCGICYGKDGTFIPVRRCREETYYCDLCKSYPRGN